MELEDFEKAKGVIKRLGRIEHALQSAKTALLEVQERSGTGSNHSSILSNYKDGSGWSIDLSGTLGSDIFISSVIDTLTLEMESLQTKLKEI